MRVLAALFFDVEDNGLNLAVNLLFLFLFVIWFALIYWTYVDARRRMTDPMLIGCAVAASCFPFIGTIVYMIVRPPEYLEDRHERELEVAAAEARLASLRQHSCPNCGFEVERSFLRCPNCERRLKEPCPSCGKPVDPSWRMCPYCEADLAQPAEARPRQRQRRAARGGGGVEPVRPAKAPARATPQRSQEKGATAESKAARPASPPASRERPSSA